MVLLLVQVAVKRENELLLFLAVSFRGRPVSDTCSKAKDVPTPEIITENICNLL